MNRPVTAPVAVDYPRSDDRPMAESDFQLEPLVYAITTLQAPSGCGGWPERMTPSDAGRGRRPVSRT